MGAKKLKLATILGVGLVSGFLFRNPISVLKHALIVWAMFTLIIPMDFEGIFVSMYLESLGFPSWLGFVVVWVIAVVILMIFARNHLINIWRMLPKW